MIWGFWGAKPPPIFGSTPIWNIYPTFAAYALAPPRHNPRPFDQSLRRFAQSIVRAPQRVVGYLGMISSLCSPENWWLEDDPFLLCFGFRPIFRGYASSRECIYTYIHISKCKYISLDDWA